MPSYVSLSFLLVALLAFVASLAGAETKGGDHFILTQVQALLLARMDPIVTPGAVGKHVHRILGGSNFNQNINTAAEQQDSTCSTAILGGDKSKLLGARTLLPTPQQHSLPYRRCQPSLLFHQD
ncbi:hypothetical protein IAU60_005932 [Kwoniella sp. DSM 27419]